MGQFGNDSATVRVPLIQNGCQRGLDVSRYKQSGEPVFWLSGLLNEGDVTVTEMKPFTSILGSKPTIMTDEGMTMMAEGLKRSRQDNDLSQSPVVLEVLKHLGASRTVLDIGAGVGRFTIPLALAGCHVTALEPSTTMRAHLNDALQEHRLAEAVTVIPNQWPHPLENQFDSVLAAYVVHFSADPVHFITDAP